MNGIGQQEVRAARRNLLGVSSARTSVGCVQVVLGTSAHLAAVGCLPSATQLLLLLPALLVVALVTDAAARRLPRWSALLAGQTAVHLVLSIAAGCAAASADHSASPVDAVPASAFLITVLHLVALGLSVHAAEHVETGLSVLRRVRRTLSASWSSPPATVRPVLFRTQPVPPSQQQLVRWLLDRTPVPARAPPHVLQPAWS